MEESKEIYESGFKEIKEIKMQEKFQILEEDIVEYVSPYTIKNETGYPIELERDDILYKSSDSKV